MSLTGCIVDKLIVSARPWEGQLNGSRVEALPAGIVSVILFVNLQLSI